MTEYDREDGGIVITDYRSSARVHTSKDSTIFSSDNPFGDAMPSGVYKDKDGGVIDTRYRDRVLHVSADNTVFAGERK